MQSPRSRFMRRDPQGRAERAEEHAKAVNTPEAWLVAADAAEEISNPRRALVYRFFATVAPRPVHSGLEIVRGLQRLGASELYSPDYPPWRAGAHLNVPFTERPVRGMKRRPLYPLFQALATYFVGDGKTELYFISNRGGVFGVIWDREEAIDQARNRNLYVEGPGGEEWYASWA